MDKPIPAPTETESDKQIRYFRKLIRQGYESSPAKQRARRDMDRWNRERRNR